MLSDSVRQESSRRAIMGSLEVTSRFLQIYSYENMGPCVLSGRFLQCSSFKKWKIALISLKILRLVDFIFCVFLTNSLHFEQFNKNWKIPVYLCVMDSTSFINLLPIDASAPLFFHSIAVFFPRLLSNSTFVTTVSLANVFLLFILYFLFSSSLVHFFLRYSLPLFGSVFSDVHNNHFVFSHLLF